MGLALENVAGLGLAQVYVLVTQFGGDLSMDSRPGEGPRIVLALPALPGEASG